MCQLFVGGADSSYKMTENLCVFLNFVLYIKGSTGIFFVEI